MKRFTVIQVDDTQRAALLFLLGGRHQTQLEPHQKAALDTVELDLRNVPTESESVVAPAEAGTVSPPAKATKRTARRGRR